MGFGVLLPLLAQYGKRLHAGDVEIGLLSASFSLMQFLFSPVWGRHSDRVGRRPVLLFGLLASFGFYLLFAYAAWRESLLLMFASRIGAGAAGATIATAQAYVADCTPEEERTRSMALIGMAFGLGFVFGPALGVASFFVFSGGANPDALSPIPGILAAALSGIAFVLALFLLPETLQRSTTPRDADARFDMNAWRSVLSQPALGWPVLIFFATTLGFTQFEGTLSLVLYVAYGMLESKTYGVFLYLGLAFALAQGLLVRRLAKKLPDETLAKLGVALILIGIVLGVAALWSRRLYVLLLVMPILVVGFAMTTPSLQAIVSKRAPAEHQGMVMGVNQSASALARVLGMALGPMLLGVHLYLPYVATAALMIAVLFVMATRLPSAAPGDPPKVV